jgi:hypothetical protein
VTQEIGNREWVVNNRSDEYGNTAGGPVGTTLSLRRWSQCSYLAAIHRDGVHGEEASWIQSWSWQRGMFRVRCAKARAWLAERRSGTCRGLLSSRVAQVGGQQSRPDQQKGVEAGIR